MFLSTYLYVLMGITNIVLKNIWGNKKPTILYVLFIILMIICLKYGC